MAAAKEYVVTAPLIVVYEDSTQRYLYRGAPVPGYVIDEHLDQLVTSGLIEQVKGSKQAKDSVEVPTVAEGDSLDPAGYNQDQVLAYLATASDEEVAKVLAAEAAGKARAKIAAFKKDGDPSVSSSAESESK